MYSHKKDKKPLETITFIRKILSEIGIMTIEQWAPTAKNLHVVRLRTPSQAILSEGKGVTTELCLASAYGELIERLQNNVIKGFTMPSVPDIKTLTQEEFLNQDTIFINKTFKKYFTPIYSNNANPAYINNNELLKKLLNIIENDSDKNVECIPFYSVKEKKEVLLPYQITKFLHGTNGMCAGNTLEEALVQGFSEILERYAAFKIATNNLIPPNIPQSEYQKYEVIMEILDYYKALGYKVEIKDCSLNEGIPVVGVFLIDTKTQQYSTSFAAHPCLPIAIERCFTETRQERDPSLKDFKRNNLNLTTKEPEGKDFYRNLSMCYFKDVIKLSSDFFSKTPDWKYSKNTWLSEDSSNQTLLENLIKISLKYSDNIYIRDVSYLGFPAYYIVIPELSVVVTDEEYSKSLIAYMNIKKIFDKMPETNTEIEYLLNGINHTIQMKYWAHNPNLFSEFTDLQLAAACAYCLEKENEAILYIEELLTNKELKDPFETQKMHCLKIYLELKLLNKTQSEIFKLLDTFYTPECKKEMLDFWINSNPLENIIKKLRESTSRIKYQKDLMMNNCILEKLDINYKNNIIDQNLLAKVINI